MSLWEEARDQFIQQLQSQNVDRQTIDQFLQDKATSDDAKRSALALQTDSDKKYGQAKVADKAIPGKWISLIMENIDKFVAIGNYAMKGAPETVGLAWFAVKQVLNGIQNNYKLYTFFGTALSNITEMMVLIRTYDKLYDDRKTADWKASDIVGELFKQIRNVYAAILDFSFSVKKHIKGGKMAKITHAVKDMFGAELPEFEGKMGTIQSLKVKILESSQGAFQEKTFEKLGGVSDQLSGVTGTLSFLSEAVQSSLQASQDMKQIMEEISKSTRGKLSHYDLALQDFDKNKKSLNPWPDSQAALQRYLKREEGTCMWIFDIPEYIAWRDSSQSGLLCVQGKDGVGKSTLAASIIQNLESELAASPDYTVQYLFCNHNKTGDDSDTSQGIVRLESTLIYQLYELATRGEGDSVLLQRCNDVFNNPKQPKSDRALGSSTKRTEREARSKKDSMAVGLGDAYAGLANALSKKVYLIIDAPDSISETEQSELASDLLELCAGAEVTVHMMLLCQPTSKLYKALADTPISEISIGANNGGDIDIIIRNGLNRMPGWSESEIEEAFQRVRDKTGPRVHYAVQVALPFLLQPFQRPISKRLKDLPDNMNETYSQHLRQLAPNYVDLLKTAMVWTLLADGAVTVQEIMDAYSGIYLATDGVDESYTNVADSDKLHAAQIRDAGGPFLEVTDNGIHHVVTLQDRKGMWEYCFEPNDAASDHEGHDQELCPRCSAMLHSSRALALSEKEAELAMAVICCKWSLPLPQGSDEVMPIIFRSTVPFDTLFSFSSLFSEGLLCLLVQQSNTFYCLTAAHGNRNNKLSLPFASSTFMLSYEEKLKATVRHLNSKLFQQRFLPAALAIDPQRNSNDEESAKQELMNESGSKVGEDEKIIEKDSAPTRATQQLDDNPKGPTSAVDGVNGAAEDGLASKDNEAEADVDDDDSQDSEDRGNDDWAQNQSEESEEEGSALQYGWFRYELAHWFHHVRQAERLWPVEERKDNQEWQTLLTELDRFCVSDTRAFEGWKKAYVEYNRETWKPLHFAACYGLTSLAELLLEKGADIMELSPGGYTSLHIASEAPYPLDILRLFLEKGADPNYESADSGIPAFHEWICWDADYDCVLELLRHGASCSLMNQFETNVIHYFAYSGSDPKILDLLLDNPIDENNRASIHCIAGDGESPLHKLMSRTNIPLDLLRVFVNRGADVNAEDKDSERPLYEAAMYGETEAIKLIINNVSDVDDDNKWGRTALHAAAWEGRIETVQILLQHGANVNKKDFHGRTPLFFACLGSAARLETCESTAELLLEKMLNEGLQLEDINSATKRGRTPLRAAAAHGFSKVVDTILGMLDPNDKDTINKRDTLKGRSALHCAAFRGRADIVAMLIDKGADATLRDGTSGDGKTALELCHDQWALFGSAQHETSISRLIDAVPAEAAANRSLLATAAIYGSVSVLEKLLNAKADFNEPDQYGWTPLLLARQFQREEAVTFLSSRAAHIGLKPSRWTYTLDDEYVKMENEGLHVLHPGDRMLCLLSDHPVPAGLTKFYYEVEILQPKSDVVIETQLNGSSQQQLATPPPESSTSSDEKPSPVFALGFSTVEAKLLQFPGWPSITAPNALSWAYHADDGGFFTSYETKVIKPIKFMEPYGFGDTIGCGVDFTEGKIFFTKNGERIGES